MPDWLARLLSPRIRSLEELCERRGQCVQDTKNSLWSSEDQCISLTQSLGQMAHDKLILEDRVKVLERDNLSMTNQMVNMLMSLGDLQKWARDHGWTGWEESDGQYAEQS